MIKDLSAQGGLEAFFRTGRKTGIQPHHAARLRLLLGALDVATGPRDMDGPGWLLHRLDGSLNGHWSVWVNGNWRLTFAFDGPHVELVDYRDYH